MRLVAGTVRISTGAPHALGARVAEPSELDRSPTALARERDALIGSTLVERYLVEAELGRGGMGTVYRARHVVLDKPVALKILHAEIADDGESRERFLREARIAAAVKHEHLVDVSDFGELTRRELPELGSNRRPWFVLELLEGETLASRLDREGPLQAREAARIFEQVARGLAAAHRAGAVHRDLKPDNVFLSRKDGRSVVKVLDFGVARLLSASRLTRQGVVFGSPHYMSPEQAAGQEIDGRSDVYSVGVALYETLSGKLPFEADSTSGVLTKHVFVEPDPIEAVVRDPASLGELGALVMRCLEKRPDARYQSADELAEALARTALGGPAPRAASLGDGAELRPPAAPARPPRPRAIIVLPAFALASIACVLGALVWLRSRATAPVPSTAATPPAAIAAAPEAPRPAAPAHEPPTPSSGAVALSADAASASAAPPARPPLPGSTAPSGAPPRAVVGAPTVTQPVTASAATALAPQSATPSSGAPSATSPREAAPAPKAPPAASSELIKIF